MKGEREREGEWHAAKGRRSELNPWPLRQGVNLYKGAHSTKWVTQASFVLSNVVP